MGPQPNEQNTSTCLLYFSVHLWCGEEMPVSYQSVCGEAQVIWLAVKCTEGFAWRLGKLQWQFVEEGPCKCFHGGFWQVRFSLARGLGEKAVRYTGPTRGRGCKACPGSHVVQQNPWKYTLRGAAGGSDGNQRHICDVGSKKWSKALILLLFCGKHSAQQDTHNNVNPLCRWKMSLNTTVTLNYCKWADHFVLVHFNFM